MTNPTEVETLLREALSQQATALLPEIRTMQQLRRLAARFPAERRRSRNRFGVGAVAFVAATAAAIVALLLLSPVAHGGHKDLPAGHLDLPKPAPAVSAVALPAAAQTSVTPRTFTAPGPDLLLGSILWVDDMHENTVTRIDLRTMRVLSTHRYPMAWYATEALMTEVDGVVLLPTDAKSGGGRTLILRFDASTGRELAPIRVQRAGAIVTTPVGVMTKVGEGEVGIIDPAAGTVTRTFRLPVDRGLAYTDGLLWGWDAATSTLVGADPTTGAKVRSMNLPGFNDLTLEPDGHALILGGPEGLARLDVRTGVVTATTAETPLNLSRDGAGRFWGAVGGHRLEAFASESLRVVRSYRVRGLDLVRVSGNVLLATDRATGRVRVFALDRLASGG